jgi:hypothetical protein
MMKLPSVTTVRGYGYDIFITKLTIKPVKYSVRIARSNPHSIIDSSCYEKQGVGSGNGRTDGARIRAFSLIDG